VIRAKEANGGLLDLSVKKVKKAALVRRVIKVIRVKRGIKETKDFLEHRVTRDPEVIRVFAENRVKEAKKVIWVIADLLEIKAQLESPEVKVSLVRLDYRATKVIRGTKERLVLWATRAIKERWECKERLESQVIQVAQEKLEKGGQLVFQERGVYQVIKEFAEIKEIRAKGANKEKEDCRVNRVSAVIAVNRARRGLLERRAFRVIRVPEEIRASVEIRGQMEILDQWVNQDYRENQVKKEYQVIEENRVIRDQKDIEVTNWKIIMYY
jgi:hypothetical protein